MTTSEYTYTFTGLEPSKRYTIEVTGEDFGTVGQSISIDGTHIPAHVLVKEGDPSLGGFRIDLKTGSVLSTVNNTLLAIYTSKIPDIYGVTHITVRIEHKNYESTKTFTLMEVI